MKKARRKSGSTLRNGPASGSPMVLVAALVTLFSSLAAVLLSLLRTPASPPVALQASAEPGKFFDGPLGFYLLLAAFGLAVLGSAVMVAAYFLLRGSSRSRRPVEPSAAPMTTLESEPAGFAAPADPLENKPWVKLVEECVELVDELDGHARSFDRPRQELAEYVILRLEEVLERSGVEVIAGEPTFDRGRHKPDGAGAAADPGAAVSETLSPGFAVGRRVLRRARVRVS